MGKRTSDLCPIPTAIHATCATCARLYIIHKCFLSTSAWNAIPLFEQQLLIAQAQENSVPTL